MKEYQFSNKSSLMYFIEDRVDDKRSHYYWGNIENFDNEMYTLDDLMEDIDLSWFEDGGVVSVYDFEEDEEFITKELQWYIKSKLPEIVNEYFFQNPAELNKVIREVLKGQLKATCNEVFQGKDLKDILTQRILKTLEVNE